MSETQYQRNLIKRIRERFPGCVILKNDARQVQGIPDILILYNNTWAMLEVKADENSPVQPNQPYYIKVFDDMSFASFITAETEEDVLNDLQRAFGLERPTRIS